MKLTRAIKPKAYTYYDLYDACRWVQHGWPELEDCDFYQYFIDMVERRGVFRLDYVLDYVVESLTEEYYESEDLENFKLFYNILASEFGEDAEFEVDW